jgi:hypothetical protein
MSIKTFFKSKRIIYTNQFQPGELRMKFIYQGIKYLRIAFTNLQKVRGFNPTTDILSSQVIKVLVIPSPFKTWRCKLVGTNAKPIIKFPKRKKNMERNAVVSIAQLELGDRFYKLSDKTKTVWNYLGIIKNKAEAIKDFDKWPTPIAKHTQVVFLTKKQKHNSGS